MRRVLGAGLPGASGGVCDAIVSQIGSSTINPSELRTAVASTGGLVRAGSNVAATVSCCGGGRRGSSPAVVSIAQEAMPSAVAPPSSRVPRIHMADRRARTRGPASRGWGGAGTSLDGSPPPVCWSRDSMGKHWVFCSSRSLVARDPQVRCGIRGRELRLHAFS